MCFLTVLFLLLIVSLQASNLNLPLTEVRYSFLCSWTCCHELNFGSLCPRVEQLLAAGLVCSFLSLVILAFSGVRRLAPSLLASAIRLLRPSSAVLSELDVLESLELSAILKNVQHNTADLVIRITKINPWGGP